MGLGSGAGAGPGTGVPGDGGVGTLGLGTSIPERMLPCFPDDTLDKLASLPADCGPSGIVAVGCHARHGVG